MISKPFLFFASKLIAVFASIAAYSYAKVDITIMVISALSFVCMFLLEILLDRIFHNRKLLLGTIGVTMVACLLLGMEIYFPLFIVLMLHLIELYIQSNHFYTILAVSVLLSFLVFIPDMVQGIIALVLVVYMLISLRILAKLSYYESYNEKQKEMIGELNKKVSDLKSLSKTLKYTASIEERNRIAAKIHDQIGHGISGSIIMLEAALLVMKVRPEKAIESIQKSIHNLREGVDEIRAELREERANRYQLGINDITAILEEFKVTYNKEVSLKTSGELDYISLDIWICIHDNLKECLTNVLKHSDATKFTLNIEVFKKIIKVEYKDNGKSKDTYEKGLGLEAIEERTVLAKGRCFFHPSEKGFGVSNIFTY